MITVITIFFTIASGLIQPFCECGEEARMWLEIPHDAPPVYFHAGCYEPIRSIPFGDPWAVEN